MSQIPERLRPTVDRTLNEKEKTKNGEITLIGGVLFGSAGVLTELTLSWSQNV